MINNSVQISIYSGGLLGVSKLLVLLCSGKTFQLFFARVIYEKQIKSKVRKRKINMHLIPTNCHVTPCSHSFPVNVSVFVTSFLRATHTCLFLGLVSACRWSHEAFYSNLMPNKSCICILRRRLVQIEQFLLCFH